MAKSIPWPILKVQIIRNVFDVQVNTLNPEPAPLRSLNSSLQYYEMRLIPMALNNKDGVKYIIVSISILFQKQTSIVCFPLSASMAPRACSFVSYLRKAQPAIIEICRQVKKKVTRSHVCAHMHT